MTLLQKPGITSCSVRMYSMNNRLFKVQVICSKYMKGKKGGGVAPFASECFSLKFCSKSYFVDYFTPSLKN